MDSLQIPKPKLVLFEGPDKVGKSTLFRVYRKATRYIPLAIDRFTGSNWVYDQFYGRDTNIQDYIKSEESLKEIYDCYLVLLTAPRRVLYQRILTQEQGEDKDIAFANFARAKELFSLYYQRTKFDKKIILNTGYQSLEDNLDELLKFTGEPILNK